MGSRWERVYMAVEDTWRRVYVSVIVIPECAGAYVFFMNGRAFYVGSTTNLRARIISHIKPRSDPWGRDPKITDRMLEMRGCQDVKFKRSRRYGDWLMVEARLIRRLQPIGNRRGVLQPQGVVEVG